jgi:phage tail sheath protein FI
MPEYSTPGVYFEALDTGRRGITAVRTDIAAFVGIAERGPLDEPTPLNSWKQFQAQFGSFLPNGYLAYTAKAFFENGGQRCYVVRVAADPAETTSDSAAVQPADRKASVVLSTGGFATGAVVTVSQGNSLQQPYLLRDVDATGRRLVWQRPLDHEFVIDDPTKPLRFATGSSAASGILLDESGQPTLRVSATSPGAWGNRITVLVTRSSPAATRTSDLAQPPDRSASLVESVVGFDAAALVRVFQERPPGAPIDSCRVARKVDAETGRITWETPLDGSYDLGQPDRPIYFETLEFSLSVYEAGRLREVFSGLSLEPEHTRYAELIVNGVSHYVRVEDLGSPTPPPAHLPDEAAANLNAGQLTLQAGRDGIAALNPENLTGDLASRTRRGLRTLEEADEPAIVAIPDVLIQPVAVVQKAPLPEPKVDPCLPGRKPSEAEPFTPQPVERAPVFTLDQVFLVQQALVAHCENERDRIALLDAPLFPSEKGIVDVGEIQSWRQRFDSTYAALYYPWVLVYDPLQSRSRAVRQVPPSGHMAGVFARTDLDMGVHRAPANIELYWIQDVAMQVGPEVQGVLNPKGINCIRSFPGRGLRPYGARTVSSDPDWRYVSVRRLMMMVEEAIEISTQWAVFEPNDFYLRQTLTMAITTFLQALWKKGALAGETAEEAFFVSCDEDNNPPSAAGLGQLIAEVGVAPVRPAEFVIFRIGRTEGQLEIAELERGTIERGSEWA